MRLLRVGGKRPVPGNEASLVNDVGNGFLEGRHCNLLANERDDAREKWRRVYPGGRDRNSRQAWPGD